MKRLGLMGIALLSSLARCGGDRGTYQACETFRGISTEGNSEPPYKIVFDPKPIHARSLGTRFSLTASDELRKSLTLDHDYVIVMVEESSLISATEETCTKENRPKRRIDNHPSYPISSTK